MDVFPSEILAQIVNRVPRNTLFNILVSVKSYKNIFDNVELTHVFDHRSVAKKHWIRRLKVLEPKNIQEFTGLTYLICEKNYCVATNVRELVLRNISCKETLNITQDFPRLQNFTAEHCWIPEAKLPNTLKKIILRCGMYKNIIIPAAVKCLTTFSISDILFETFDGILHLTIDKLHMKLFINLSQFKNLRKLNVVDSNTNTILVPKLVKKIHISSSSHVSYFLGLEYCDNLKYFYGSVGNKNEAFPVRNNNCLQHLTINSNLHFSVKLPALKTLNICKNKLPLIHFPNLEHLSCGGFTNFGINAKTALPLLKSLEISAEDPLTYTFTHIKLLYIKYYINDEKITDIPNVNVLLIEVFHPGYFRKLLHDDFKVMAVGVNKCTQEITDTLSAKFETLIINVKVPNMVLFIKN